jgi:hypothetical protein
VFKILLILGLIGYVVYRFGRKIYQVARIIAGVGDAIAHKQKQANTPFTPPPSYQDKENNINVYSPEKPKKKDPSGGDYVDYEEVK